MVTAVVTNALSTALPPYITWVSSTVVSKRQSGCHHAGRHAATGCRFVAGAMATLGPVAVDAASVDCSGLLPYVYLFAALLALQAALLWLFIAHLRRRARHRADSSGIEATHHARLALAGELTASIAHEIAQPLSAILNNVETTELLLQQTAADPEGIAPILADIKRSTLRAHEIVNRLRALLRKRELQLESVEVNELVGKAVQLVRADTERRHVQLCLELEPGLPLVRADGIHMQQVVLNLLMNAMDAMSATPPASRWLHVRTRLRAGTAVEVSVRDNGPGIDPSQTGKVFESFFSTKEGGMGLGLSIARSVVLAHGGTIWAERSTRGGTIFTVRLPLPQRHHAWHDHRAIQASPASGA